MPRTVAIYRDDLLPISETFIAAQAASLTTFVPLFVGLRRVGGLDIPGTSVVLAGEGAWGCAQRARIRLFGIPGSAVRKVASHQPAIVHAHFGLDGIVAMALSRRLRLPLVVTFHGYDATSTDDALLVSGLPGRLYVQRRRELTAAACKFICVSRYIRAQLIDKGVPEELTHVHYTGIDTQFFVPDRSVPREPIVLFVGRLVEKKGCEYVVRAMARVQARCPSAELVVIGDGPLRAGLEAQARGALRRSRFLGKQPSVAVRDWMNRAMVFCAPSVVARSGDAEGFGMVFAEAQSMGTPVVAFASGGIPEAVQDRETGFLAPERDVDQLAENIIGLLTNRSVWERFSEAGQSRVRRLFDLRAQTKALEDIYAQAVADAGYAHPSR